jgi:hypothetical protein
MKRFLAISGFLMLCFVLLFFFYVVQTARPVRLISGGKVVATATTPFGLPWKDRFVTVHTEGTNLFKIWEDCFDDPVFLYCFSDRQRFLCVYDYDVAVLVFVVDCRPEGTNPLTPPLWPPDDDTRKTLGWMMTNVVVQAKGAVRLPTYAEVQETSSFVRKSTSGQFRAAYFGIYCPKNFVLMALDTNRNSCWPTK